MLLVSWRRKRLDRSDASFPSHSGPQPRHQTSDHSFDAPRLHSSLHSSTVSNHRSVVSLMLLLSSLRASLVSRLFSLLLLSTSLCHLCLPFSVSLFRLACLFIMHIFCLPSSVVSVFSHALSSLCFTTSFSRMSPTKYMPSASLFCSLSN